jgi:hypothetical protein
MANFIFKELMNNFYIFIKTFTFLLIAIFIPSAILEPALFYFVYDYNFFLTSFIGFIFNLIIFQYHRNFKVLYIVNLIFYLYLILICAARVFYFNVFEFVSRWNYILYLDFSIVAKGFLLIILLSFVVYLTSKFQKTVINKLNRSNYLVSIVTSLLIIYLLLFVRPIYENKQYFRFQASHNGFGHEMKRDYTNFFSDFTFEKYPNGKSLSINNFYESKNDKEFLLILESWGKLKNDSINSNYLNFLVEDIFNNNPYLKTNYKITIDSTNFYGSSIGAEARELFNGKSDDAYLYYMHGKNIKIEYNLMDNKKKNNYYAVAGYSSSGKFGVNASNVFDFRRRLGFNKIFTYENLNKYTNRNTEIEGFSSVYDEVMIDSLLSYTNNQTKYFGYGFTTNTHFPFIYNSNNKYITRILNYKSTQYLSSTNITENSKRLLTRIISTISHLLSELDRKKLRIDKIIIVGDHKFPGYHDFSSNTVPALMIELIK